MGLFDEVLGSLEAGAGQHAALYEEVAGLVTQAGGVGGLVQKFEQQGVGGLTSVATGAAAPANSPITADQIVQVIGPANIGAVAARVGLTEPQVAEGMARLLPLIVSHLTAGGTAPAAPAGSQLESEALGLLKSKLFGS
jgi:uncharacterized protein YidB (DUF937 family)